MISLGVLGYGYWGPNLVRCFSETPDVRVTSVADPSPNRLAAAFTRYPFLLTATDPYELIADPSIDAVAIATPVATHFELALAALRAGKHVLVEKPLAASSEQAARLMNAAERRQLVLMVDHTFLFTSAVREMRALVARGAIGDVVFYEAMRTSLARFQPDVGVVWDLAVHDLSILDFVAPGRVVSVQAVGAASRSGSPPDIASIAITFDDHRIAHIHVNWQSALKVRRTIVGGSRGTLVYDEAEPVEKLRVYETATPGTSLDALRVAHRAGPMHAPVLADIEPLKAMASHFSECVRAGSRPDTDGDSALRVIRLLEAATTSMANHGQLTAIT